VQIGALREELGCTFVRKNLSRQERLHPLLFFLNSATL
jgi:hypothetical protein